MEKNFKPNFEYADFASMFKAEFYDPDYWANIIKSSGAKLVLTYMTLRLIFLIIIKIY